MTHGDSSVGFTLPAYTSDQQTGCPVNNIEISGSGTSVTTPTGVEQETLVSGNYLVKPSDNSIHQAYTFYAKVTAAGGSSEFFGQYALNVGCNSAYVTYADNSGLVTSVAKSVGDSLASAYTLQQPTST